KFETFLGYTYVRVYPSGNDPAFSMNGGSGQFVYNFKRWVGAVVDAGAVTNNNFAGLHFSNTQIFFMGGPRVTFSRCRFQPYVQAVFGGVHYTADSGIEFDRSRGQTNFAMATGVGLNISILRWLGIRPGSIDYYYTRIGNLRSIGDTSQNN